MEAATNNGDNSKPVNEIDDYWSVRYLPAMEGTWRTLGFNMTKKYPSVSSVPVHLSDSYTFHQYHWNTPTTTLSLLDRYFVHPLGTFPWDNNK